MSGVMDSRPVTTERRTPTTRILPGDYVRDMEIAYRTGVVTATCGCWADVQWSDGPAQTLAFGYLERIPGELAT